MIALNSTEIKPYIESSLNCIFSSKGLLLKNSKSTVRINLEKFEPQKCVLNIWRDVGSDDEVIINKELVKLIPNKYNLFTISDPEIIINRIGKGTGNIYLSKIELYDEKIETQSVVMNKDWTEFLRTFGDIKGIKLTDIGLMAAEYAEIPNADSILNILTDPPNSYVKKNNKLIFINPCRIFDISFNEIKKVVLKKEKEARKDLLYDSGLLDVNKISEAKNIHQSGDSITLNHDSSFVIPISILKGNCTYSINILATKISGNGKFGVAIISDTGDICDSHIFILPNRKTNISCVLSTGYVIGNQYNVKLYRPEHSSTGSVLATNITISLVKDNNKPDVLAQEIKYRNKLVVNKVDGSIIKLVEDKSKYFSVLNKDNYQTDNKNTKKGVIYLNDFYSRLWYNRMRPSLNIKYIAPYKIYYGEKIDICDADVAICSINNLCLHKRIYCHEFVGEIPQESLDVLSKCSQILTPSLLNEYQIKQKLPNANISTCSLPWIFIGNTYNRKKQFVYLETSRNLTEQLVKIWDDSFGNLIIIGSNIRVKNNIKQESIYQSYPKICSIIMESSALIYLNENVHHESALTEFAKSAGLDIITNNINYIMKYNIIRTENGIININQLISLIKSSKINTHICDKDLYNKYVDKNISVLVGEKC